MKKITEAKLRKIRRYHPDLYCEALSSMSDEEFRREINSNMRTEQRSLSIGDYLKILCKGKKFKEYQNRRKIYYEEIEKIRIAS